MSIGGMIRQQGPIADEGTTNDSAYAACSVRPLGITGKICQPFTVGESCNPVPDACTLDPTDSEPHVQLNLQIIIKTRWSESRIIIF